ncbi:hypothetical protein sos41_19660 [Alphaproteobacteria bacterium SO-S41]|nr:hypothetical protein sos41_19660 [Alphaproteobacteria bacterium SO-S41]
MSESALAKMMTAFPGQWASGKLMESANPQIARVLETWRAAAGDRAFPAHRSLGPVQLKAVLPNVHIYDVRPTAPRYAVRLIGTRMTDHLGAGLAGKLVDEIPSEPLRHAISGLLTAVETGRTFLHLKAPQAIALPNGARQPLESLWLPCADDGETIDRVIVVSLVGEAPVAAPTQKAS